MRDCCQDETNRSGQQPTDKPELTYTECLVCGAKHYELDVDTADLASEGAGLG